MYGDIKNEILQYNQATPTEEEVKQYSPDLMEYLPFYYDRKQGLMKNVQSAIGKEAGRANYSSVDMIDQFSLDTATWGLAIWEAELGIETDITKTYDARRESIKARLRGTGTFTKEMLKNAAMSFTNAEIDITENHEDYSFIIKFTSVKGIPPNKQAFTDMIETIKPAHLGYSFEYTYSWWDNIKGLTWNEANAYTWDKIREY